MILWAFCSFAAQSALWAVRVLCRLFDIYCSYETLIRGLTFTVYSSGFLSQPTSAAASPANNTFHTLPLSFAFFQSCSLSFMSATHLAPVWQPPQCTIESSWPEITLGKGRRSALQLCWRQWHNSNTNRVQRFKTCTAALQPGRTENLDWIWNVRRHLGGLEQRRTDWGREWFFSCKHIKIKATRMFFQELWNYKDYCPFRAGNISSVINWSLRYKY